MKRIDAIRYIANQLDDELVICNLGIPSQELYSVKDLPNYFYMLGSIGLASSIGLGLALSIERKVVILDGDGSLLYNLGSLVTVAQQKPRNLYWIVLDNQSHGSTGFQPTYDASLASLEKLGLAAGMPNVESAANGDELGEAMEKIRDPGPLFLVVKIEKGNADVGPIPLAPELIKSRFTKEVRKA
jgi:sulfopyruvate decarboxylase subunit beta